MSEENNDLEKKVKALRSCIEKCLHDLTVPRPTLPEKHRVPLVINRMRWTLKEVDNENS